MRLGSIGCFLLISGIVVLALCVIFVWVPIIAYVSRSCVDMEYVSLHSSENVSGQVMCNVTRNRAVSVRVQLEVPNKDLIIALLSNDEKPDFNYSIQPSLSGYFSVPGGNCAFVLTIPHSSFGDGTPLLFEEDHRTLHPDDEFAMFVFDSSVDVPFTYHESDYPTLAKKAFVSSRGNHVYQWWRIGSESSYDVYFCNPNASSRKFTSTLYVKRSVPGFHITSKDVKFRDAEDVIVELDQNVSSSVEQRIIVQYNRSSFDYRSSFNSSAVVIDINSSDYYKHCFLGSYLLFVCLGVICTVLGALILLFPQLFVCMCGSHNMRNSSEDQALVTTI